ncbi:MAG: formylglycine-generating enzyme family protein [Candidatus Delongbacteria bacterium]|nr:formylglycine-generating enzyme family protein [Candidatus Delongbacteria bacterium]MCG2760959.1 formylglycine-generating enzyme family protein [Candidatus Delongbacteria bacterium]
MKNATITLMVIFFLLITVSAQDTFYDVMPKSEKNKTPQDTIIYKSSSNAKEAQLNKKVSVIDDKYYYSKDNKRMILVPSQVIIMGSDDGSDIEKPAHKIKVQAFYMDETEVTNRQYKKYLKATNNKSLHRYSHMKNRKFNADDQPVVDVDYYDAAEYAKWAGKRLPTEAEWECAAKDGQNYEYATGETISPNKARYGQRISEGYPMPVKSFRPNSLGIYDLSGNVAEWVHGVIVAYPGNTEHFSGYGKLRIPRGGSWYSKEDECKTYKRSAMNISNSGGGTGFRCVIGYNEAQIKMNK